MARKEYDELFAVLAQIDQDLRKQLATGAPSPPKSHADCKHAIHGNAGKVARAKCRRRRQREERERLHRQRRPASRAA